MNNAHFHMVINHFPIILPVVGIIISITGIVLRSEVIKRTALFVFVLGAVFTIPAFVSGEGAEEIVEEMEGIGHRIIHEHEEKAEIFAILSYILGAISLVCLWINWKKKTLAKSIFIVVLLFSGFVLFFAQQTGTSGGEIRHTEIRKNANSTAIPNTESENEHD